MHATRYLLIGGGLVSSQGAKQLRQLDPDASITLVSEERHPPYDRPPLSKDFLRGETPADKLLFDPEPYFPEQHIDLILGVSVERLNQPDKTVSLSDGRQIRFEKALLATGRLAGFLSCYGLREEVDGGVAIDAAAAELLGVGPGDEVWSVGR